MHGQRVGVVVIAAGGILGSFLPWVTVPLLGSIAGTAGSDGWVTVVIAALGLLAGLVGNRAAPMTIGVRAVVVLSGLGLAAMGFWKLHDVYAMKLDDGAGGAFGRALNSAISAGPGLYLLAAAGVALFGLGLFASSKRAPVAPPGGPGAVAGYAPPAVCARCGAPMVFVTQYQRWLCQADPQH